jgi:hypothetical protein
MMPQLCTSCGEPILTHPVHGMHDDCDAIADMDRLREIPPGTRPKNERRIMRMDRVDGNRYQAVWNDLLPTAPTEKGEVVCLSG